MENLKFMNGWEDTQMDNVVIKEFDNFYVVMGNIFYDSYFDNDANHILAYDRIWKDELFSIYYDKDFETVEEVLDFAMEDLNQKETLGTLFTEDTEENIYKKMNYVIENMITEDDYYDIVKNY